mgnify:FL=1
MAQARPATVQIAHFSGTLSRSASQAAAEASEGIRQSPRGLKEPPETTLGPLGNVDRLNWFPTNRRRNSCIHPLTAARS